MQTIDLLWWGSDLPSWALGDACSLPADLPGAAEQLAAVAASTGAPWLLLWDPGRPLPEPALLAELTGGRADAWHAGLAGGLLGVPEEHDYLDPLWPLGHDAGADVEAVSWRIDLGTLLVRAEAVRTLGSLDLAFEGRTGAGLELGRRLIDRGAVVCHAPRLVAAGRLPVEPIAEPDRFALLQRTFPPAWARYAAARRALAHPHPRRVAAALRTATARTATRPRPSGSGPVLARPAVPLPPDPSISVVVSTSGRSEAVARTLAGLADQTIVPTQVVIQAGGIRDPHPDGFDAFGPAFSLEVLHPDGRGPTSSRNEAVRRTTGEWIAFVGEGCELAPDLLERHLDGLVRYQADLTTGAAPSPAGSAPAGPDHLRVADRWDATVGLCRRDLFGRFGLFEEQIDDPRLGEQEFGLRVQLGGGLVLHVPGATATGGGPTSDDDRSSDAAGPDRPRSAETSARRYYTRRYHSPRQAREDRILTFTHGIVPADGTARAWAGSLATEIAHLPATYRRSRRARLLAERMVAEGPRIGELEPR
jgi:glycosyltransferase involved in cell wall biosynthesis